MNIIIQFFLQAASTKIMAKLIQTETIVVTTKNTQKIVVLLMMTTLMQMKCAADVRIKVILSYITVCTLGIVRYFFPF